jgi:plasmid stabilization system protein ParE
MKLEFHPEADLELLDTAFHYDLEIPGLGERFGAEVKRITELLLEYPIIGREVGSGRRKLSLHRFPFTMIYAASPDVVYVLAVAHDRRRPGYWRSRG